MTTIRRIVVSLLALLPLSASPVAAQRSAAEQLTKLLEENWEYRMKEFPTWATRVGDHRYDDRLSSVSLADSRRRNELGRDFLKRLDAIDRDGLPREGQVNYDIFRRELSDSVRDYEFGAYRIPISNRGGFHISFPELRRKMPLGAATEYENYIARLNGFSQLADGHIELMRKGLEDGWTLPSVVLEGYREPLEVHLVDDPEKSLFFEPFKDMPNSISAADQERLKEAARQAIRDSIVPGYRRFLTFMQDEYVPKARSSIGASAMPGGRDYYRFRVRQSTTLDVTPEEVHQIGLAEVKRIRAEMLEVIKRAKFDGDFAAFVKFLRTDPRFYAKTPEELMRHTALVLKKIDGRLPELFQKLPRMPYGIQPVPDYIAPRTTTAYYQGPAGDGTRAGFYFVNTYDLKSRPLYEIEALSLHEAVPGHHLQIALQQELTGTPAFRRFTGFTAFTEGWALYAERLGLEVGFYQDPYNDFGRLTYEMWRACRLVVDTGIHYFGWTRDQAIDFMAENTALSMHNIRAEVDRYIAWPSQALGYKMGELKIRELRGRAEKELGPKFDLRQFHDVVLGSGSVPLDVLEENVANYIRNEKREVKQTEPISE